MWTTQEWSQKSPLEAWSHVSCCTVPVVFQLMFSCICFISFDGVGAQTDMLGLWPRSRVFGEIPFEDCE